nr:immunoglobulin light chain junction region [Macaca mulatta]
CQHSHVIPLTF